MKRIVAFVALLVLPTALAAAATHASARPAADAMSRAPQREPVTITYLGNAGWQIEAAGKVILVDPYLTQFRNGGRDNRNTNDDSDPILTPDQTGIDAHIRRADYILITHGHSDHMLDAPYISNRYHAAIVCSPGSANIARAYGVSDERLIVVHGGEDYAFDGFSLRVIPSLHSPLLAKRYNDTVWAGTTPPGLHAPLHESAFVENGTFAFLLRIGGHRIFIMGGMNYIDTQLPGLRPDIALIGAGASRRENYDYARRLMTGLNRPAIVLPTHWDSYGNATRQDALRGAAEFSREVRAASPRTRVIIPDYFAPIRLP
jgi:L-ascorbate metabolism protein UlaG (beta-lactamase superfamily)